MNSSRWGTVPALCVQAVNGTNELKYAVCEIHLLLLFYAFSDADGIDVKPKFMCITFNFVGGGEAYSLLDEEGIRLQTKLIGQRPPISQHTNLEMKESLFSSIQSLQRVHQICNQQSLGCCKSNIQIWWLIINICQCYCEEEQINTKSKPRFVDKFVCIELSFCHML